MNIIYFTEREVYKGTSEDHTVNAWIHFCFEDQIGIQVFYDEIFLKTNYIKR